MSTDINNFEGLIPGKLYEIKTCYNFSLPFYCFTNINDMARSSICCYAQHVKEGLIYLKTISGKNLFRRHHVPIFLSKFGLIFPCVGLDNRDTVLKEIE